MIPTLTTERLTLRAPRPDDVPAFARFYASDAARHVGGPMAEWEVWRYLAQVVGHWTFRGFGRWIVTRRDEDAAIGLVGLHFPPDWPEPEIGWMVWAPRQGIGTEAGRAARDWAYGPGKMTTLISSIDPANAASVALAERLGARREGAFDHPRYGELGIWRHPGPQDREAMV
jgi:RimJ/RimL family protein N-acetyltransferase